MKAFGHLTLIRALVASLPVAACSSVLDIDNVEYWPSPDASMPDLLAAPDAAIDAPTCDAREDACGPRDAHAADAPDARGAADASSTPDSPNVPDAQDVPDAADANTEVCQAMLSDGGDGGPSACSISGNTPGAVTFINNCTSRTISLFWVDYGCSEIHTVDLLPNDSHVENTYLTHPFRFRDKDTGELLKDVVPSSLPATVTMP